MNLVRLAISLLIALLVVVALLGVLWWQSPPDALASYGVGGRVILGVLALSGLIGLWQLWTPPANSSSLR